MIPSVARIQHARLEATLAANATTILLYYDLGCGILAAQRRQGWGAGVIAALDADLKQRFPEMRGFSARNLKYMRAFAAAWPDRAVVQNVLSRVTWHHNIVLLGFSLTGSQYPLSNSARTSSMHLSPHLLFSLPPRLWCSHLANREYWTNHLAMISRIIVDPMEGRGSASRQRHPAHRERRPHLCWNHDDVHGLTMATPPPPALAQHTYKRFACETVTVQMAIHRG
ncbi:MAG TPA: DUF1016 N-terminal domain-containing protein, partial [Gemmatimonadaceae bacterium]|nr:DUF1016 N-terminal domain-containing protein [Gemmatimonadaceae bacterium]